MTSEFSYVLLGYMIVWVLLQAVPVILIYPDENGITYRDDSAVCYKYERRRVECPPTHSWSSTEMTAYISS